MSKAISRAANAILDGFDGVMDALGKTRIPRSRPGQRDTAIKYAHAVFNTLRTDEAVERVARGMCRLEWPDDGDCQYHWENFADQWYRVRARAAIAALLEEA